MHYCISYNPDAQLIDAAVNKGRDERRDQVLAEMAAKQREAEKLAQRVAFADPDRPRQDDLV